MEPSQTPAAQSNSIAMTNLFVCLLYCLDTNFNVAQVYDPPPLPVMPAQLELGTPVTNICLRVDYTSALDTNRITTFVIFLETVPAPDITNRIERIVPVPYTGVGGALALTRFIPPPVPDGLPIPSALTNAPARRLK